LIVRDLAAGPRRRIELHRVLPGISSEQLRSRLNRMVADGLLTRRRYREVPPRVEFELTGRARDLMPVVAALARWGYEWTWGPPREREEVDVGAILRLAPGLLVAPPGVEATIECIVTECSRGDPRRTYALTAADGHVEVTERPAADAVARVIGSEAAWVAALGPNSSRSQLKIDGDRALVDEPLRGFAAGTEGLSAAA
jgi:DNA-binding HxlR family transcriptional regulator